MYRISWYNRRKPTENGEGEFIFESFNDAYLSWKVYEEKFPLLYHYIESDTFRTFALAYATVETYNHQFPDMHHYVSDNPDNTCRTLHHLRINAE